jgi:endonuclease/exonuclease/phosphatase family metal-dependent hydrolase
VNNSGAHIIGLQEIAEWKSDAQNQHLYFKNNLASKYEIVYFGDSSHRLNIATVYDKTVFTLLSQELYWFSDTPDVPSSGWDGINYRAASVLMLEHKTTGEIVKAINTHGPLSDEGNVKAFELIANRSLSEESDTFTFLCGDFNAGTGKLGYVPIAEKLQDCRLAAEESPNRGHNTYNGYGKYADNPNSNNPIDHCFVSSHDNVKVLNYQVRVDRWGENNYLSDHYAIETTVRIYNNAEKAWTKFY